ncbi:hypothetical protein BLS_002111 [Venturia inaequalis]|uniref:Uncharacterized protein n=1 Tax=Venturia inaequalis TaxID=5025 RepID=A0A8H3U1I3_VENIN|nr:hypothetical protein BLS_002111 [Venturia inaequalis]KAE9963308.1 hypothetical protein EG328_011508 [Venturia inaequalis]RDI88863.1 Eukaryotic translation initiation factor 3 subunit C [Venturia inaequalis]
MDITDPNIKTNTSFFHRLPNEIVDDILVYVFQEATRGELSSTNSTYEEFTPFFDSQAFEGVDQESVKLTLYQDMLGELAYAFLEIDTQLEGSVRYALGKVLMGFEANTRKRGKIVENLLKTVRKKL